MSETTGALLALWNDVTPELDASYNDWHANEHVPERLGVPGMLWGYRFQAQPETSGPRYLTLYGMRDVQVLESDPYRRLLSHPTPASARMRPHLHNVSRWVCQVRRMFGDLSTDYLKLWTLASLFEAERMSAVATATAGASLLAEHVPAAAPLPWLGAGQAHAIQGQWLFALGASEKPTAVDDLTATHAWTYSALPVGSSSLSS